MSLKHSIFIILYSISFIAGEDVTLQIPNGRILGRKALTTTNKTYFSFQKIPYASPPIGHLRFQPPKPVKNWNGVLNATRLDVICYQLDRNSDFESEDCLYLNVYTPQLPHSHHNGSLPVMVWIYGGSFANGHSLPQLYGPDFLLDEDVIVVTFNYRVGAFGFLSTEDDIIPGNVGLKDQLFAIKWVNKNIKYFGGDPKRVVLFGESAGGGSVSFQLLNKKTEGLYRGVICESGFALDPWAIQLDAREKAFMLANHSNNDFNDDSKLLHGYLLNLTAKELDRTAEKLSEYIHEKRIELVFAPVIETEHKEAFITTKIYKRFLDGEFVKVPVILGFNSEEALHFLEDYDLKKMAQFFDEDLNLLVPPSIKCDNEVNCTKLGKYIRKMYTDGKFSQNFGAFIRFLSDSSYNRAIIRSAELLSKHTNTYLYQFSYDGKMGDMSQKIDGAGNVAHFEEVRYLWRMELGQYDNTDLKQFPKSDILTHYRLLKLWTNFAKTLNPTCESIDLLQNTIWCPVDGNVAYLDIGEDLEMKTHPKNATYSVWKSIFRNYANDDINTY